MPFSWHRGRCFILPYVLRHLSLPPSLTGRKALLYVTIQLLLLFLLFGVCCVSSGESWFLSACLWTAFGVTLVSLPFLMKEIPLPILWAHHKALIYFSFETLLLLLGLLWEGRDGSFLLPMLPCALLCLALPWGWASFSRGSAAGMPDPSYRSRRAARPWVNLPAVGNRMFRSISVAAYHRIMQQKVSLGK